MAESPADAARPPSKRPSRRTSPRARFLHAFARWGTVTAGVQAAQVPWRTARRWMDDDPAFRSRLEEARARFEDSLRHRMLRRADRNDPVMLRFIVKGELMRQYGPRDAIRRLSLEEQEKILEAHAEKKWDQLEQAAAEWEEDEKKKQQSASSYSPSKEKKEPYFESIVKHLPPPPDESKSIPGVWLP